MADWENLGKITAKCNTHATKKTFYDNLLTSIVGNRVMYKTGSGYVIVKDDYKYYSETYNAKYSDSDGDVWHLNVPYWD